MELGKDLTDMASPAVKSFAGVLKDGIKTVGDTLGSVPAWIELLKTGKLPGDLPGASGIVNYANNEGFLHKLMYPFATLLGGGGMIGHNINAAQEARYKYDVLGVGKDHFKRQSFWAPEHDYGADYRKKTEQVPGARFSEYAKNVHAKNKPSTGEMDASNEVSNAIMRGGGRQQNFYFNAPLYKVEHQTFQNIKDSIADLEPKVKEALLKIMYSVPA